MRRRACCVCMRAQVIDLHILEQISIHPLQSLSLSLSLSLTDAHTHTHIHSQTPHTHTHTHTHAPVLLVSFDKASRPTRPELDEPLLLPAFAARIEPAEHVGEDTSELPLKNYSSLLSDSCLPRERCGSLVRKMYLVNKLCRFPS